MSIGVGRLTGRASMTYTPFDDTFEPNDAFGDAKAITSGTAIHAIFPTYAPVGFNDEVDDADWYLAPHAAGAFTVSLTDVPAEVQAEVSAYFVSAGSSSMGSSLGNATGAAKGSPVSISGTLLTAGSIRIAIEGRAEVVKGAVNPPPGFVQKYSLLVN